MAIGKYEDVYNVDEYEKRVANIASSIASLSSGNFYFQAKANVEKQIEILKAKEEKMFQVLKVKSVDELNNRIQEYKKAVINFSGANLQTAFLDVLEWKNKELYDAFNNAVQAVINEMLNNEDIADYGIERARKKVLQELNSTLVGRGGRFRSSRGMVESVFNPSRFTKEQREHWKKLLREKYNQIGEVQLYLELEEKSDTDLEIRTDFTWTGITESMTPTEAKKLKKIMPSALNEINIKMKQLILSYVDRDQYLIMQILNYLLDKDEFFFFIGKNTKAITGQLGEIQGLYYLAKFLGDDLDAALDWQGGLFTNGSKPHQDILLENLFGIQVKNSAKDIIDYISFKEGTLENITINLMEELQKTGLDIDWINLIKNYYGTLNFNVEYHRDRRKRKGSQYLPGIRMTDTNADRFIAAHQNLLDLDQKMNNLFGLFASTLMFLDIYPEKTDANVLFLVGADVFEVASNILHKIVTEIDQQNFKITTFFNNNKNIITAFNSGNRSPNYSEEVIKDIKLTSSFNFSYLYQ